MSQPVTLAGTSVTEEHIRARPLRLRVLYTRYPHWGAHSGMTQLLSHLDPRHCAVQSDPVNDSDDDLPVPFTRLRDYLRRRVQHNGMAWYKLSDLAAELRALPGCLTRRTDILHFLDGEHSAQFLPQWLRRWPLPRTKLIATFHQTPEMLARLVSRDVVASLDAITVVSAVQAGYFTEIVPAAHVHVVPHGVDTTFFKPEDRARDTGRFTAITTGHWQRDWAALHAVATLLASEPGLMFHLVTNRPTGLDALPNVVVHRDIDDDTLLALYQSADCLLLPLVASTANNSLLEGLACGLPVISTDLPAVRAYLRGEEGILVDRNAPDGLADAVRCLRRDPDRRARMASSARLRAEEFAWSRVAREYERVYRHVAGSGRRAR